MIAFVVVAAFALAAEPGPCPDLSPAGAFAAAAADLAAAVPADRRHSTRYLDLSSVPPDRRDAFTRAILFALNSTSTREALVDGLPLVDGRLLRLDLASIGWDRAGREVRLRRLEGRQGVRFGAISRADLVDPWEAIVRVEPFFKVSVASGARVARGWIDPAVEVVARSLSGSSCLVARADWLLPRILTEAQQGGFYSLLLMLPPDEADLYKAWGVDVGLADADSTLKHGGAVLKSIVALHNRELQRLPGTYGQDVSFIWRTFDFSADDVGDKSVLEALGGTAKHDGREIIGSLANGLHWYYLADGAGRQAAVVPQTLALDNRARAGHPVRDRNVVNAYKCIDCHGPQEGIYDFEDVVSKVILAPDVALAVVSKGSPDAAEARREALEDYYLRDLRRSVGREQESYAAAVARVNGLKPGENSDRLVDFLERYVYDEVAPADAAREMGLGLDAARALWRRSGNGLLAVLAAGQNLKRVAWEKSFADAQRAAVYPWESSR